jgi:hypothetical protein
MNLMSALVTVGGPPVSLGSPAEPVEAAAATVDPHTAVRPAAMTTAVTARISARSKGS